MQTKNQALKNRICEILRNHEEKIRVISARIKSENISLKSELNGIYMDAAYPPHSLDTSGVHKTSALSKGFDDAVDDIQNTKKRTEEFIASLTHQLYQIKEVETMVGKLDTVSKSTLLALYYPHRTYEQAAELLDIDKTTIYRRRKIAIKKLVEMARRSKLLDIL